MFAKSAVLASSKVTISDQQKCSSNNVSNKTLRLFAIHYQNSYATASFEYQTMPKKRQKRKQLPLNPPLTLGIIRKPEHVELV